MQEREYKYNTSIISIILAHFVYDLNTVHMWTQSAVTQNRSLFRVCSLNVSIRDCYPVCSIRPCLYYGPEEPLKDSEQMF